MDMLRYVRAASTLLLVRSSSALLLLGISAIAHAQGTRVIVGTVRDSLGIAAASVDIEANAGAVRTRTISDGTYRLTGLQPGLTRVTARRIGFLPVSKDVTLGVSTEERRVDFVMAPNIDVLSEVSVSALRDASESRLAGFNARSKRQVGHFVTRERIDRANSTILSDMLREIPGVHIGTPRNQGREIWLRGATCAPLVFVDGFPAAAGAFDVDIIDLVSVEGIEVYSGLGSIPPEFTGVRDESRCGVIAIWSRPARARKKPSATLGVAASPSGDELRDVRTADEVDTPARLDNGGVSPYYPDSLLSTRVAGRVVVEVVVDTLGIVEPASFDVLTSTDDLFTDAVRVAVFASHFTPALLKGRRVRQFMQLPYNFKPGTPL